MTRTKQAHSRRLTIATLANAIIQGGTVTMNGNKYAGTKGGHFLIHVAGDWRTMNKDKFLEIFTDDVDRHFAPMIDLGYTWDEIYKYHVFNFDFGDSMATAYSV